MARERSRTDCPDRRPRQVALSVLALAAVIGVSLGVYVPRSSFLDFCASTISIQLANVEPHPALQVPIGAIFDAGNGAGVWLVEGETPPEMI